MANKTPNLEEKVNPQLAQRLFTTSQDVCVYVCVDVRICMYLCMYISMFVSLETKLPQHISHSSKFFDILPPQEVCLHFSLQDPNLEPKWSPRNLSRQQILPWQELVSSKVVQGKIFCRDRFPCVHFGSKSGSSSAS